MFQDLNIEVIQIIKVLLSVTCLLSVYSAQFLVYLEHIIGVEYMIFKTRGK